MAGLGRGTKDVLCRYYANNACNKGDSCPFSHDRSSKPDMICRYYLAGTCVYGDRCRYDHKHPPETGRSADDELQSSSSSTVKASSVSLDVKEGEGSSSSSKLAFNPNAPVFVPSWMRKPQIEKTFASVAGAVSVIPLCPYFENGFCEKAENCRFVHGAICDICGKAALHPADEEQNETHRRICEAERQAAMEILEAKARSVDKVCSICMENIWERQARFGILQRCKHCFCLGCIQKWRSNTLDMFAKDILRSCPECRVHSDFVIPARYWVEDPEEKAELIKRYLENNKKIQCKYIKGNDISGCPFGNKCFFKHELPDGTIAEGESPQTRRRRRSWVDTYDPFIELDFDEVLVQLALESIGDDM